MARTTNPFADPASSPELPYGDVEPGQVLGGRYQLQIPRRTIADITEWQAFDETLSRPVRVWVVPPNHHRTETLLGAARAAAQATDARFLRVLDALEYGPVEPVSAIVTEDVPAVELGEILRGGPLSGLAAGWLTAQLASGLAPLHALDLFHQRLSPATVRLTPRGDVRVSGFLLEAALTPRLDEYGDEEVPSRGARQRADLDALGQLMYACLTGYWPLLDSHEPADLYGLPPAPRDTDGALVPPSELRPGLSLNLEAICLQTLEPRPDSSAVRRAADLASILSRVLGNTSGSEELATRVCIIPDAPASPVAEPIASPPTRHDATPAPTRPAEPPVAAATGGVAVAPVATKGHESGGIAVPFSFSPTPTSAEGAVFASDRAPQTSSVTLGGEGAPTSTGSERSDRSERIPEPGTVDADETSTLLPAVPHLDAPARRKIPWWWGAVALLLVVAVVVLAVKACGPSAPPPPKPIGIVTAYDFDPVLDGGSGDENPDQVPKAFDGDPTTVWTSLTYLNNPKLGLLKPGVGLVLDLGGVHTVSEIALTLGAVPVTVEIRVPVVDPAATKPPMDSQTQWTRLVVSQATMAPSPGASPTTPPGPGASRTTGGSPSTSSTGTLPSTTAPTAGGTPVATPTGSGTMAQTVAASPVTLVLGTPTATRWLLVYFTSLAPVANAKYQAIVGEIAVRGQG